ncbi:MAG: 2-phosphosulfolactate phosphatase [Thermoproteota archaeon]
MRIDVFNGLIGLPVIESDAVVAIDVLRSSTTIITALANSADRVIPVSTVEEALSISSESYVVLGGEVESVKPPFFQLGNSPLEYVKETVEGKTVVLYTSSGTRLLRFLGTVSQKVLIGAIVNWLPLTEYLKEEGFKHVSIVTAGKIGRPALEDVYCAGLIVRNLPGSIVNREGEVAAKISELSLDVIKGSRHARELVELGLEKDVEYCLTPNSIKAIARLDFSKGCIRLL